MADKNNYLPGENVLEIPFKHVVLTNLRLQSEFRLLGERSYGSLFLKDIKTAGYEFRSKPRFLATGFFLLLLGLIVDQVLNQFELATDYMGLSSWIGVFLFILSIVAYYQSRVKVLYFSADGIEVKIKANGFADDKLKYFIHRIREMQFDPR
jgi:hypothetical protein